MSGCGTILCQGKGVVVVVGWRDKEIARGWEILALVGEYRRHMLIVTWLSKADGRGCRGSMWVDVHVHVEVVACRVGEIKWGVGCFTPNVRY